MPVAGLFVFSAACATIFGSVAGSAAARVLTVGAGGYATLGAAAAAVRPGDTINILPGVYVGCAVIRADDVRVEGSGAAETVLTGPVCQGKALLVTEGARDVVRALTLRGAAAPDGNGAGIRLQAGSLTVEAVRFISNEDGILTAAHDPRMTLTVRGSRFERNGSCAQECAHGIYAGHIARLRVMDSVFWETREGHHIKSRAARTEIAGCTIADGAAGRSSYLVDLPDGGDAVLTGNRFEKGPHTENASAAISVGEELRDAPARIVLEGNVYVNESGGGVFLRGAPGAVSRGNLVR